MASGTLETLQKGNALKKRGKEGGENVEQDHDNRYFLTKDYDLSIRKGGGGVIASLTVKVE